MDHPTIYFVRHGETDWNRDRRYQGQKDIPLNETGRAQAHRNGLALRAFLPAIAEADFIASPLGRARETMEALRGELGLPPEAYAIDARLMELSYGVWEGTLQDDVMKNDPESFAKRAEDPFRWRPDQGESYADLFARVSGWAETIGRDCVVVSHGGVSRCLRAPLWGSTPRRYRSLKAPRTGF